jgi:hypothetical protein
MAGDLVHRKLVKNALPEKRGESLVDLLALISVEMSPG